MKAGRCCGFCPIVFRVVFVAAAAPPEQPVPGFLHFAFIQPHHSHLPQPAILMFSCLVVSSADSICTVSPCSRQWQFWSLVDGRGSASTQVLPARRYLAYFWRRCPGQLGGSHHREIRTPSLIKTNCRPSYRRSFNDASFRLKPPDAVARGAIDHFKSVNDTTARYRDQVLRLVAPRLAASVEEGRPFEWAGRVHDSVFRHKNAVAVMIISIYCAMKLRARPSGFAADRTRRKFRALQIAVPAQNAGHRACEVSTCCLLPVSIGVRQSRLKASSMNIGGSGPGVVPPNREGRNRIEVAGPQAKPNGYDPRKQPASKC